uniref:Uncharacterized protein n=1 Tax=Poecilia mexicana TaxID=48701 RepID=A0A3B3X8R2_9TELE
MGYASGGAFAGRRGAQSEPQKDAADLRHGLRFSNFSSPDIHKYCTRAPSKTERNPTGGQTGSLLRCPGSHVGFHASGCWCFSPSHPETPYPDISSVARRLRRSTLQEPRWSQLAGSPS